jgi:hypothetical protein
MAAPDSDAPPSFFEPGRSGDNTVLLSILLLLVAGDLLTYPGARQAVSSWLASSGGLYLPTAAIGGLVGFGELVSRYRDAPWRVAIMRPGLLFIGVNALASALALFLLAEFHTELHAPDNNVLRVILAGTGAMVVVRTKIFTVRQPSGSDIAVGPAFILDTMLSAINREVDRRRAQMRVERVARGATAFGIYAYDSAVDFLAASLAAFQNLDTDITKKLDSDLRRLATDSKLAVLDDEVKFLIAGYSLLTEFGDRAFDAVFTSLAAYLKVHGRPAPPEPGAAQT